MVEHDGVGVVISAAHQVSSRAPGCRGGRSSARTPRHRAIRPQPSGGHLRYIADGKPLAGGFHPRARQRAPLSSPSECAGWRGDGAPAVVRPGIRRSAAFGM